MGESDRPDMAWCRANTAMTATEDPVPLTDSLAQSFDRLRAKAATVEAEPDPEPDPVIAAAAREGMEAARRAWWSAHVPSRFQWASLEHYGPGRTLDRLTDWVQEQRGRNLVIPGLVGTGKTHCAFAAVRPLVLERGLDVEFQPVVKLLELLRREYDGRTGLYERCEEADVLILDDLGVQKDTGWSHERMYSLVNDRWMNERPTVVTTNFLPRRLAPQGYEGPFLESLDERLLSRLVGSEAVVVMLSGDDRRRKR